MAKRMIIMLVAMLLIVGGIISFRFYQLAQAGKAAAAQETPPVSVSAELAREDTWQPALRTTGSLVAVQGVVLSNEYAGVVDSLGFEAGDMVKKGTVLLQLNVSVDTTMLRSFEAAAELARQTFERAKVLRESNVSAQSEYDSAKAQYDQAIANADNMRATIARKSIVAPFDGKLGLRQVNLGQFLAVGTPIVSLQSLDPIYVNFTLPQQFIRQVAKGQSVELSLDSFPGQIFKGAITAFDSQLDSASRTIPVQATLDNKDGRLQPGMFGSVAVLLPQQDKVVTVPQSAVTYNPYGNVIYVIEAAAKQAPGAAATQAHLIVRQQFVKLGETRGDQISVLSGLKAGEQIVTSGQLKLRDGVGVQINNTVPAANSPTPTPPNT
jgi:membrane fusion protein (multidrug efflux system)